MNKPKTVFQAISDYGHDIDFEPETECEPTSAVPGSQSKIDEMKRRVELGQPLWHSNDVYNFEGETLAQFDHWKKYG